jgi:hypothetical protein
MKVYVVFDFPEIPDVDSEEATFAIDSLSDDLKKLASTTLYQWYIHDEDKADQR